MRVSMTNDHTFRIRLNPIKPGQNSFPEVEDHPRWEVPDSLLGDTSDNFGMRLAWGNFSADTKPTGIELSDPLNPSLRYLSTRDRNLIFSEKYIEMGFLLDSRHVYGFGERHRTFELNPGSYSAWTDGRENIHDPGDLGNNLYGDHPFILARLNDNSFVGLFFKNSNAKALEYTHVESDKSILNFKAVGGVLDFFAFIGENPEDVIKSYHQIIGVPHLPPFWALGFHQSSWQYNTTERLMEVAEGYDKAEMPLETVWLDIEYMNKYRNFEVDNTRFKEVLMFREALRVKHQHLVANVNPGFAADDTYSYYRQATLEKIFIKSNQNPDLFNGNLIGKVWPGKAAFIDFYNPKSANWWVRGLKGLYSQLQMDGIWLDMNEVTSFCDGECPNPDFETYKASNSSLPFSPTGKKRSIEESTLSLDGQHYYAKEEDKALNTEFNMHSLYGAMQSEATFKFWDDGTPVSNRRPFILSRSTFAGSGKYAAHWLGDNKSEWGMMQLSIAGIMNFNMFGIPFVGADVCGFNGKFEDEMCARWMQLSAFYPFARNHYNMTDNGKELLPPQEPFNLKAPYNETARQAILQRYSFLRYYYTRLYEINARGGGTLVRPLFFEFPEDEGAYNAYEHTFMVGNALKVTPVLRPSSEHKGKVQSYFPANTRFISLYDFKSIINQGSTGRNITLDASLDHTIVHMKEGTIIPYQNTTDHYYPRTYNLINDRGLDILVFPDKHGNAEGTLYIDRDGDDQSALRYGKFEYYILRYSNHTLRINLLDGKSTGGNLEDGNHIIRNVYILGVGKLTAKNPSACAFSTSMVPEEILFHYDQEKGYIKLNVTNSNTLTFHEIQAIQFTLNENDVSFCHPKYKVDSVSTLVNEAGAKAAFEVQVSSPTNLPSITVNFILIKNNMVRIVIRDPKNPAFNVTDSVYNPELLPLDGHLALEDIGDYVTVPKEGEEFYFEIHEHKDPQRVLYSTKNQTMIYTPNFMQITSVIDSNGRIFGLGERVGDFLLEDGTYTLWNRDAASPVERGKPPGNNMYGTHPVYFTQMQMNTKFFAVFDNNAGAQDFIIEHDLKGKKITHVKTSGITDMVVILSDHIQVVLDQFNELIGKPAMVPEWALGWNQCRYGYNNTEEVREVVEKYRENNLPLDAIWTDIDYMEMYRDFTLSSEFTELPGDVSNWKNNYGVRYVPILDAAVAYEPDNKDSAYHRGSEKKIFIQDANDSTKPFIGRVWPGPAVYVDWLKEEAEQYWIDEMKGLHDILEFDGMWIDMNEAANFCHGPCTRDQRVENSVQNRMFYIPGSRDLNTNSISIDAKHADGTLEYEAHSLYGFYMSKATSNYFTKNNQRPFVLTRSTYTGVGKYAAHWLGDNFSTYEMMKLSVNGVYLFNALGVPVVGADICGFIGNTYPELCARWYALGAFYPFARNHNDKNSIPQEPYVSMFKDKKMPGTSVTYTDFMREASLKRYALHRYQYSYLHKSSNEGGSYFKPLFFNYPEENDAYTNLEQNILLGDSVKLSPIVGRVNAATFYFPGNGATWCPIWPKHQKACFSGMSRQTMTVPYDEILLHIKSGTIIPLQLGDFKSVPKNVNIKALRDVALDLAIYCDPKYAAHGFVRFDDGKSLDLTKFTEFQFRAVGASPFLGSPYLDVFVQISSDTYEEKTGNQELGSVVIYNASQFKYTNASIAEIIFQDKSKLRMETSCDKDTNICRFSRTDGQDTEIRLISSIHIKAK